MYSYLTPGLPVHLWKAINYPNYIYQGVHAQCFFTFAVAYEYMVQNLYSKLNELVIQLISIVCVPAQPQLKQHGGRRAVCRQQARASTPICPSPAHTLPAAWCPQDHWQARMLGCLQRQEHKPDVALASLLWPFAVTKQIV